MKKEISVVIVTYNSEKHIYGCLESLFKYNDIGDSLEVIIVDNMSKGFDLMKATLLERYGESLLILENNKNGGYGQGNNVGIRASSAPIIMIMNPDVRLEMPLFKRAIQAFETPNVVQFGVRQLNKKHKGTTSFSVSSRIHPLIGFPLTSVCNTMQWFIPKIMYLVGACFFIRKRAFEEIGLFDERLFMYMEEDDVQYRLMKQNPEATIAYDPSLSYAHLHGLNTVYNPLDFTYEKTALRNSILINGERGYSKQTVIKRQISWYKMYIWKKRLLYIKNHNTFLKDNIWHLKEWVKQLKSIDY